MIDLDYIFILFGIFSVLFGLYILISNNILYAALALIGVFFSIAGIFVISYAPFLAVTQIMIYIGGVLILVIFGIMLTQQRIQHNVLFMGKRNIVVGSSLAIALAYIMIRLLSVIDFESLLWVKEGMAETTTLNNTNALGKVLMEQYVFPFELAAVMLLVVLIGAMRIAGKDTK